MILHSAILLSDASRHKTMLRLFIALSSLLILAACGLGAKQYDKTAGWSAQQLYADAKQHIAESNWKLARERLTAIESRYPFGVYAQQALIELGYVNWKDSENEQALAALSRFQQLYPNHPGTDYVLYLEGLINFTPASAFMSKLTRQDPSERDPKGLRASYDAFNTLIKRYPNSIYTPDAEKRVAWLVNTIALNEVHATRYYYERSAYVAAVNRAQAVITDFEGAPATEEALYLIVQSYDKLGLSDLRDDAQRVMDQNFPNSIFKERGLKADKGWWNPFAW